MTSPLDDPARGSRRNYRRALLAVVPLLAIGLFDLVLLLGWGLDPTWGFLILPPILFVSAIGWIYFRAVQDDADDEDADDRAGPTR